MPQPYQVFIIYAREDTQYLEELRGQLRPLEIGGRIRIGSDREINPGVDWEKEIVERLRTADIVLILVSGAYYNSAYIHEIEIKYALDRHEKNEAKVLPIIVRSCSFGDDPIISRLQVLPTDGRPVNSKHFWPERDDAWLDVVSGLKKILNILDASVKAAEKKEQDERRRTIELADLAAANNAWEQAVQINTVESYKDFTAAFPSDARKKKAQENIRKISEQDGHFSIPWYRYAIFTFSLVLLFFAFKGISDRRGHQSDTPEKTQGVDSLIQIKTALARSLDSMATQYAELRTKSEVQTGKLNTTAVLVRQQDSIVNGIMNSATKIPSVLRTQIASLKGVKAKYANIISQLTRENLRLDRREAGINYAEQIRNTQSAPIKATSFGVSVERGMKIPGGSNLYKPRQIIVTFDLLDVPSYFQREEKIYLVITDNTGGKILDSSLQNAVISSPSGPIIIMYQDSKTVMLAGAQRFSFNYKFSDHYKPGDYVVAVYSSAGLLGTSDFRLL